MLLANRYQVVRMLGEGGFGQTFLAEDTQMPSRRMCVVKQLKPATNEAAIYQVVQDRFQREAAILEKLGENHPQIPKLYAYFSDGGQFYLVQEWIEGATLEQLVSDRIIFHEDRVRKILLDLLPVLEFIHAQGMIHRDIKPENIILRQSSQEAVLIDYGAVRETMGTVFNSRGNPTSSIVIGTPGYMPSEQAAGRPIPSSDLYSLGLTAIYLLTGRTPHMLDTDPQTGEIVWQQYAPQLSSEFAAILTQMVRSYPRDRYASAAQVRADVEPAGFTMPPSQAGGTAVIASSPDRVVTPPPPSNNSKWIAAGAVGGSLLAGAIAVSAFLNRDNAPAPVVQSPPPTTAPTSTPSPTTPPSPVVKASPLTVPPVVESPVARRSPDPSPVATPTPTPTPQGQAISEAVTLEGIAGGKVQVYSQPSTRSSAPHYGLTGDRVTATRQAEGDDREIWYFVKFPTGAEGWVQAEQTRSIQEPPKVEEFPRSAQLIGSNPGSRINLRSAPSTTASSPSYGLVGDQVVALRQAQGDDGKLWYFIEFPSKASGWVREDLIDLR